MLVAEIGACTTAAVPALTDLLAKDWQWALGRAVGIWLGTTSADAVLADAVPQCRDALAAARPFLAGRGDA